MSLNSPIANVLSHIQNYERLGKSELITRNNSKIIRGILEIMQREGYIGSFEEIVDSKGNLLKIHLLGNINKVNIIKPHFQIELSDFEKFEKRFLPAKNFGLLIISTNKGLLTHNQAKENKIGGKLLAYCY
jgi:small subunit ribosomal protein S8